MGSAHALPLPARLSLRLAARHIVNGLELRTVVAASALAILAVAGAAIGFLLPQSSAPPHTTVLTPVSTTSPAR